MTETSPDHAADTTALRPRTASLTQRRRRAGTALVLAVLLGGLAGSLSGATAVDRVQQRHAGQLMDRNAEDVSGAVANEAARYVDTLSDLAAAIGAQSHLTADAFAAITSKIHSERLPGVSGVRFVVPTSDGQLAAVQSYWRARGSGGLRLAPVGTGREHAFAVFSRTINGTPDLHGVDLNQAAESADTMLAAHDTGRVAASPAYVLLTDRSLPQDQQQLSFLLAARVSGGAGTPDAGHFRGWVLLGMRGADFVTETLRDHSNEGYTVSLADVSSSGESTIVASTSAQSPTGADPLDRHRTLRVGQRDWQLLIRPDSTFLTATDRHLANLVLAAGVLITLLLTTLVAVLARARNRALAKVDQATAALRVDIEQRKTTEARLRERESQLEHLAFHDPLTGLANRALFYDRTEHAITAQNRSNDALAVFFIDLDGFKQVNDERGHAAGDVVLAEVATRLRRCARNSDTVARLGGDEFAILAERMAYPADAEIVADRIVRALASPFDLNGQPASVSASVGVALRQPSHRGADDLLQAADHAMYTAKVAGKGRYALAGALGLSTT